MFGVKRRNCWALFGVPFTQLANCSWIHYDDAEAMKWIDLSQQYATEILRFLATVSA